MKKFCLLLAILASVQIAGAQQVKSVAAARSSVEKAEKASQDAKKSVNPTTWIKLGQAYMEAYYAAQGDGWLGATDQELSLVMSGVKPIAEEQVVVAGTPMLKRVYDTKNYYFNSAGQLAIIETTTPVIENALGKAIEAYKKASELDVKGKKSKDIVEGMKIVDQKCLDEAYMAYNFGDLKLASEYFEKAANAFVDGCPVDTNAVYNVGFTSYMSGDYDRAKEWFNKSIAIGFDGENGEAFAKLADIADRQATRRQDSDILRPHSQSILRARACLSDSSTITFQPVKIPAASLNLSTAPREMSRAMLLSTMWKETFTKSSVTKRPLLLLTRSAQRLILTMSTDTLQRASTSTTRPWKSRPLPTRNLMTPSTMLW